MMTPDPSKLSDSSSGPYLDKKQTSTSPDPSSKRKMAATLHGPPPTGAAAPTASPEKRSTMQKDQRDETDGSWCQTQVYTAASSSGPSSQRYRLYQSLSPGFRQTAAQACTHTQKHTWRETHRFTQSIKLINRGMWWSKSDNGPSRSIVQPFVVHLNGFYGVCIFFLFWLHLDSSCHITQPESAPVSYGQWWKIIDFCARLWGILDICALLEDDSTTCTLIH